MFLILDQYDLEALCNRVNDYPLANDKLCVVNFFESALQVSVTLNYMENDMVYEISINTDLTHKDTATILKGDCDREALKVISNKLFNTATCDMYQAFTKLSGQFKSFYNDYHVNETLDSI